MTTTIRWVRFEHQGRAGFGILEGDTVAVHEGDLFAGARATGRALPLQELKLLMPVRPGKVLALWNNYMALAKKLGLADPDEPLYFMKAPSSYLNPGETIVAPAGQGKIVFEGELAVVIGRRAKAVSEAAALEHVFGYTCCNDVTAAEVLNRDASFAQWVRAKSYDTFCPLGPCIATGLDPATLVVKTLLDGQLRQDYPVADIRFSVARLVSLISHDMTLEPGDVILCGTSVGVGSMKHGQTVEVQIDGIGTLRNRFETQEHKT
jgi:2-keto-4-pentenoate hydratase/2-oxohepta-3-ene-1,7-dioic acid hydratase in catechol pathway